MREIYRLKKKKTIFYVIHILIAISITHYSLIFYVIFLFIFATVRSVRLELLSVDLT